MAPYSGPLTQPLELKERCSALLPLFDILSLSASSLTYLSGASFSSLLTFEQLMFTSLVGGKHNLYLLLNNSAYSEEPGPSAQQL